MRLPSMKYVENTKEKTILRFLGVNYSENTRDGELSKSLNLSSRMFPCLSQRPGRESGVNSYDNATAVWYRDGLMVVDGTELLYNGVNIGTVMPGKKQFANVNTKVVIFPDKIMYDTSTGELRSLAAEFVSEPNAVEFTDQKTLKVHLGSYRGEIASSGSTGELSAGGFDHQTGQDWNSWTEVFDCRISSATVNSEDGKLTIGEKEFPVYSDQWKEGDLFLDASLGMDGVKSWGKVTSVLSRAITQGDATGGTVKYYTTRYVTIKYDRYEVRGTSYGAFSGFEGMNFRAGDTVEISGCVTFPQNNKVLTIRAITEEETDSGTIHGLVFDAGSFDGATAPSTGVEEGEVKIERKVPDMTVICERDNRLYGAEGQTIYVSALGDPTNIYTYESVDTDSYAVAVATEGDFTGCIGYGNSVLFFKEDCMHKLMGSYPSQFALYDYTVPGVLKGSEHSLWNINEVVYYHGREGVYRYAGGSPELITENFGLRRFDTASAGAQGDFYYISMREKGTDRWGMWVYDIMRGLWLQEDETEAVCFARDGGKLYYISGTGNMVLVNPDSSEEDVEWCAELCRMDEVYLNRKCYSKLLMRLELEDGASVKVEVSCDGGSWVEHKQFSRSPHKTVTVPIRPNRCDSFQIRLSGRGRVTVRTLVREFELGSQV